jgi:alpha-glucosidase (family GH31 glycosyl hydrolase)
LITRRARVVGAALVGLAGFGLFECAAPLDSRTAALAVGNQTWTHPQGNVSVDVTASPFGLTIRDAQGSVLLESAPAHPIDPEASDPLAAYAALSFTHDEDTTLQAPMKGWDYYRGDESPWQQATTATAIATDGAALVVSLATTDAVHTLTLRIEAAGPGVRLLATVDDPQGDPTSVVNRVSLGWTMHDDAAGAPGDHFLGLGERFYQADHRGQSKTYVWVEDKGLGQGEDVPPGPSNPLPNGPTMTYIPMPWFMSPRGFGVFLSSAFRTVFHLGEEAPDAWRFEDWTSRLDATIFVDPDPKNLLEDLTAVTGRPPAIADWVLAPRRRADLGSGEWDKLRAANVPTSVIDTAVHYFPNGGGSDHASLQAVTAELHAKGFKAIAYFCPFVSDQWHPVFDDLSAKGWLVKHADGTAYTVLDPPYNAGMIDFTNADAVAWYQQQMQQALDDGWDGWMYDFAEYIPTDAVFSNGMGGMEAHNLYPLLYQQAVRDLMETQRPGDYLVFVRSGYAGPTPTGMAGTGGLVPMVWAGDESTDFDVADGLPGALTAALNAGMSGIPLWGSDISGYHYIYNPPPDKEVYLRWTELGAFSADMHDENEGAGNGPSSVRWQIWDDPESLGTYVKYAAMKTQMLPYVKLAVSQAHRHGWPVMRHLFLDHPRDPRTWTITDEYMYGDSLLVAPVVQRGATSRSVYLPEAAYFDYWSGARVQGAGDVTAQAGLDVVPVYARVGGIVPMLSPDVQTVVAPTDPGYAVVTAAQRADFLAVDVFAGGQTSVTLDDGTTISQSAPTQPFTPASPADASGPIAAAANASDLTTCNACAYDDPTQNVWSVAVLTQSDTITAGPLTLSVSGAPSVKRFVLRVRH